MNQNDYRAMLKGYFDGEDEEKSDQQKGLPQPPLVKAYEGQEKAITLPPPEEVPLVERDITRCIKDRVSDRKWSDASVNLAQLSYLLWATQGVKTVSKENRFTKRTVPSGGSRHPFETYLVVNKVEGLKKGVYRYLPLQHEIVFLHERAEQEKTVNDGCCRQTFCGNAPLVFCWSATPYRAEWRYRHYGNKSILLDAGHLCQNLYLACVALGLGTCAIAAYMQKIIDDLLGIDGEEEFTVYLAPVGVPVFSDSSNRIS